LADDKAPKFINAVLDALGEKKVLKETIKDTSIEGK